MAAKTKKTKTPDPLLARRAEQRQRNAAATEVAGSAKDRHEAFRSLNPEEQKAELDRRHRDNRAAQRERNAAVATTAPRKTERVAFGRTDAPANVGDEPKRTTPVREDKSRTPVREDKAARERKATTKTVAKKAPAKTAKKAAKKSTTGKKA